MAQTFRLQDNIPVVGILKYADYAPSEKGDDQIALKGDWVELTPDGEKGLGAARVYLHMSVRDQLLALGVLREDGQDKNGHPAYKVNGAPKVRIVRATPVVDGKKQAITTATLDGNPAPAPAAPKPTAQSAAARPANGNGTPPPAPPDRKVALLNGWRRLFADYVMATKIAAHGLAAAKGVKIADLNEQAIQAGAATVLIEGSRRSLESFPGMAKRLFEPKPKPAAPTPRTPIPAQAEPSPAKGERGSLDFTDFPEKLDEEDEELPF